MSISPPSLPFCDWRVNVHDCVDAHFFWSFHVAAAVLAGSWVIWIATLAHFRSVREGWATFAHGANLALFMVGLEALFNFLAHVAVLSSTNLILTEIAWSGIVSSVLFPCLPYLGSIVTSFPPNFTAMPLANKAQDCMKAHNRDRIMLAFVFSFAVIMATLFGLAGDATMRGDIFLKVLFHRVAMFLASVIFLPCMVVYLYFVIAFFKAFNSEIVISSQTKEEQEAVRLNMMKIKHNFVIMFLSVVVYLILILLISFYPDFFSNLTLSKAFAVFYTLFLEVNCFFGLVAISRSDYQKHQVFKAISSRTNSNSVEPIPPQGDKAVVVMMSSDPLDEFLSKSRV